MFGIFLKYIQFLVVWEFGHNMDTIIMRDVRGDQIT